MIGRALVAGLDRHQAAGPCARTGKVGSNVALRDLRMRHRSVSGPATKNTRFWFAYELKFHL